MNTFYNVKGIVCYSKKGGDVMKVSWIFWWLVTIVEVASFLAISAFLWLREVDATGAVQTTELKLLNIAVLAAAFIIPFIIQVIWLVMNLVIKNRQRRNPLS